jgi:hypothetical protein
LSPTASFAAVALHGVSNVPGRFYYYTVLRIPSVQAGVAILSNLLVGLLAGARDSTLDSLSDVVDSLLGRLHCGRGWIGWKLEVFKEVFYVW